MAEEKNTIIISLGGSLVAPGDIDLGFLKNLKHVLVKYLPAKRFFVLVGGGKVCRNYQKALLEFGAKPADRDWIGINVSRLNAEVVKQLFFEFAYPKIIADPTKKIKTSKNLIVGAGWKPGWSTDYDAVLVAKTNKIKTIINLTNVDFVYDKNPAEFPDARPLKEIDWRSFERIVGDSWTPGLSMPFDPKASKLAGKLGLQVAMINGKNLERLEDFLNNKPFTGTIIK